MRVKRKGGGHYSWKVLEISPCRRRVVWGWGEIRRREEAGKERKRDGGGRKRERGGEGGRKVGGREAERERETDPGF